LGEGGVSVLGGTRLFGARLILNKEVFGTETLELLHCTLTLLVIVMFHCGLGLLGLRSLVIEDFLLREILLVTHGLIVEGLAMLEDLHLILIKLHTLVVF
jgi:hypothetical protein